MQYLVFAIEAGSIQWLGAHGDRQSAVDHINNLRPDGQQSDDEAKGKAYYEFAFIVESPHFVSFV